MHSTKTQQLRLNDALWLDWYNRTTERDALMRRIILIDEEITKDEMNEPIQQSPRQSRAEPDQKSQEVAETGDRDEERALGQGTEADHDVAE